MSVIRNFRWVVTIAIVAVCAVTVVAGASVTGGHVNSAASMPTLRSARIAPEGPLVNLTDLEPGDQRSTSFTINNPNSAEADAHIYGSLTSGSQMLYDALVAEVSTADEGVVWRGQLGQLIPESAAIAPLQAYGAEPVTLTISVPPDLGDNFQAQTSRFNLGFGLDHPGWLLGDQLAPRSQLRSIRPGRKRLKRTLSMRKLRKKRIKLYGRATDTGSGVARVEMSLSKVINRGKREKYCRNWNPARSRYQYMGRRKGSCRRMTWFNAIGAERFRYVMKPRMTKRGRYILRIRAIDKVGNIESSFSPRKRNSFRFRIR
ncbi:MAG: hypothetical protein HZB14_07900 [Actinobacteria bacterium]|nr:hypothetical protein [Actinomycetota bacterium]